MQSHSAKLKIQCLSHSIHNHQDYFYLNIDTVYGFAWDKALNFDQMGQGR